LKCIRIRVKSMRVLQLISSTGYYGAESVVATLADKLPSVGIETFVGHIRYGGQKQQVLRLENHVRNCEVIPFEHNSRFDIGIVQRLRKELKRLNIDAIHSHGYKPDFYGGLAAKLSRIPVMSTCHLWTRATPALRSYANLDAMMLRRFDKVVAVSEPILRELQSAGVPAGNLALIPNGISTGRFATAAPIYRNLFDPDAFIFGVACRQVAAKGVDLLLRAIPRVSALAPSTRFLIAGDGPCMNEYVELARSLGVDDKVIFLGRCNSMPEFYASLNTFVLPSRDEGLPIALLEAMASGRMVIATDVGSVSSVVRNQENGLLITAGNLEALVLAMLSVVSNRDYLARFGCAAQSQVSSNYSFGRMVRRYAELYRELRPV
jgi:glycosyltransferase involved in cell wall biosynthesis